MYTTIERACSSARSFPRAGGSLTCSSGSSGDVSLPILLLLAERLDGATHTLLTSQSGTGNATGIGSRTSWGVSSRLDFYTCIRAPNTHRLIVLLDCNCTVSLVSLLAR